MVRVRSSDLDDDPLHLTVLVRAVDPPHAGHERQVRVVDGADEVLAVGAAAAPVGMASARDGSDARPTSPVLPTAPPTTTGATAMRRACCSAAVTAALLDG